MASGPLLSLSPVFTRVASDAAGVLAPVVLDGSLLDRWHWIDAFGIAGRYGAVAVIWLLAFLVFHLGSKAVGISHACLSRSFAVSVLWLVVLIAILLIPDPSRLVVLGVLGFAVLAWFVTGKVLLRATLSQTAFLGLFASFSASMFVLVAELGMG